MGSIVQEIKFDDQGLVPCIVQDFRSGEVLMLAYMNGEAFEKTVDSKDLYFWSRSRRQLWRKGETSGNTLQLKELRYDCDIDSLLAIVEANGPACHTGERSCFHRAEGGDISKQSFEALPTLLRTLSERKEKMPEGSYTSELLKDGVGKISEKILEEAEEVTRAGAEESDQRLSEEFADLIYHLLVLLSSRAVSFDRVEAELIERMK